MMYGKLYINNTKKARSSSPVMYTTGGFYRAFLIVRQKEDAFAQFLGEFGPEKPLYGLIVNTEFLAEGPLSFMQDIGEADDRIILIPTGLNTPELPLSCDDTEKNYQYLSRGVRIDEALLFSRDTIYGYIDPSLVSSPLDVIQCKTLTISKDRFAGTLDIVSALWKHRNSIQITSITQYKKRRGGSHE